MRLLDIVAQATTPLIIELPDGALVDLPGPAVLARSLRNAPLRYVLDDNVTAFAARFAFTEPERLLEWRDIVRMPAGLVWFEWEDSARTAALRNAGFARASSAKRRAGLLITSDVGGRRGTMETVWQLDDGGADLSPVVIEFDLDDPSFSRSRDDQGFVCAAELEGDPALQALYGFMRFRARDEWLHYYRKAGLRRTTERACVAKDCGCVAAEFPFVVGLLLALSARNAIGTAATALSRLNRARERSGKAALLDYTEVCARLDGVRVSQTSDATGAPMELRQHFVSGHLVRRAGQVFWRRAHLRGNPHRGVILGRNINVRMDEPLSA